MTLMQARPTKLSLCVVLFFAASGFATNIPVNNPSFEDTTGVTFTSCGSGCSFSRAVIPGWTNGATESGQLQPSP